MKISKLNIEQYKHLENLEFDFTYQTGERKGQPLDKICFIGQSATGKTNLLDKIFTSVKESQDWLINGNKFGLPFLQAPVSYKSKSSITIQFNNSSYFKKNNNLTYNGKEFTFGIVNISDQGTNLLISPKENSNLHYFKANLISDKNIEIFSENPIDLIEKHPKINNNNIQINIFDSNVPKEIWLSLIKDILFYRKKFTQKMSELIHKGLLANQKKLSSEFTKWQKENPNKLEEFALKFNPLIKKLNLEIDLVNTEYSIPISNKKNEEIIPIQNTSTGTKGLLLTFLPLFKLDTKDAIILMDEPERSLYPDMQMDLIEHYQNLAPDAQFIVATHSPFIAASFEAEERFILYFDEDGKVAVRRGSSPIGDDPNDMLKNDFGVNYYNKHGEEAYKKYLNLKQAVVNEKDPKKKKELLLETVKLGDVYNF